MGGFFGVCLGWPLSFFVWVTVIGGVGGGGFWGGGGFLILGLAPKGRGLLGWRASPAPAPELVEAIGGGQMEWPLLSRGLMDSLEVVG